MRVVPTVFLVVCLLAACSREALPEAVASREPSPAAVPSAVPSAAASAPAAAVPVATATAEPAISPGGRWEPLPTEGAPSARETAGAIFVGDLVVARQVTLTVL